MENTQIDGSAVVSEEVLEEVASDPVSADGDLLPSDGSAGLEESPDVGISEDVLGESDSVEEVPSAGDDRPEDVLETEAETEEEPEETNEEEEGQEEEETPVLSSPAPVLEGPLPVYLVDAPEEEEEAGIEAFSVSGSPYPGTISSTYLDYFAGIADKLGHKEHYIAFRASQTDYYMAWGEGLMYDGSQFKGSALSYCRIYTGSGSYNMSVTFGSDTFYLTPGTGFVYSDLEHFASLTEGGTHVETLTLLFAVGFAVVYSVCHDLFDYVMAHVYRK